MTQPRLLVFGSGGEPFRSYVLRAMKEHVQIILAANSELTWQKSYVSEFYPIDTKDPSALAGLVKAVRPDGLLTYDEQLVEQVTAVGAALGVPGTDIDAVRACRDKYAMRTMLAKSDLSPVRCEVVFSAADATAAAWRIGYPVVVEPRALGGSIGVVQAVSDAELLPAFEVAIGARADDGTVSA